MTPYSQDLRQRIVYTIQRGEGTIRQVADRFLVSFSFVTRLLHLYPGPSTLRGVQSPRVRAPGVVPGESFPGRIIRSGVGSAFNRPESPLMDTESRGDRPSTPGRRASRPHGTTPGSHCCDEGSTGRGGYAVSHSDERRSAGARVHSGGRDLVRKDMSEQH